MATGTYRLELSSSNRAGCQNKECKDQNLKIAKGQLRFGTYATIGEFQTWKWKHWGCVTPKQIAHLKAAIEDNLDLLDGYDELPEPEQAKVRQALADGHIADEDWTGDPEMNREGKNGYRIPRSKKKAREEEAEREANERSASPSLAPSKKRARVKQDPDAQHAENEEPATKKAKATPRKTKKVKTENDNDGSQVDAQPQEESRKRTSQAKTEPQEDFAIKHESNDDDADPQPPAKKARAQRKAAPKKAKAEAIGDEEGTGLEDGLKLEDVKAESESEHGGEVARPKKGRKKSTRKAANGEDAGAAANKTTKAKKPAKNADSERTKRTNGRATRVNP